MKKIGFIAGPALGHVSRLYVTAVKLRSMLDVDITFVNPSTGRFMERVVGKEFDTISIPIFDRTRRTAAGQFGSGLERVFDSIRFDLIVHDLCPLKWISETRFPDCPRINVTNIFLTQMAKAPTFQALWYDEIGDDVNRSRTEKGLPELSSAFDLYEADLVLLADPWPLAERYGPLPAHYRVCGSCSWSMAGELPSELSDVTDALLLSMGSTGRSAFDIELLRSIASKARCACSIYIGNKANEVRQSSVVDHAYDWLPLNKVLDKVKVVMCQGGVGSTYQAISTGAPVIVFPAQRNQEVLGEILEEMGVGVCISNETSFSKVENCDFDGLSANARALSSKMSLQNGAEKIAAQIAGAL